MTVSEQVISVFTGVKGHLDDVELNLPDNVVKARQYQYDLI